MEYGILRFEEPQADTSRKILHVDMDAFYANIEIRDNPKLKGQSVVIGRHPHETGGKGIVATCNYEARKFGIHSAMPVIEAYRRCPQAVFVAGNMAKYQEVSQTIRQIFYQITDLVEPLSLDEAYLDVTVNKQDEESALRLARWIQAEIYRQTQLTCSIGVSYNKFIAKIASDYHKPFGITLVSPEEALEFLKRLPIKDFYGIGKKSLPYLKDLGIEVGADLYQFSLEELIERFGKMGYGLYFRVRGIHNSPVNAHRERKSVGKERTFRQFIDQEDQVYDELEQLSTQVVQRLQALKLTARTMVLKIRYDDFETLTRQVQLDNPSQSFSVCYNTIVNLWDAYGDLSRKIRLLGVSATNLDDQTIELMRLDL